MLLEITPTIPVSINLKKYIKITLEGCQWSGNFFNLRLELAVVRETKASKVFEQKESLLFPFLFVE